MPTNLAIDDSLLKEAQKIGHHKTKKEAVNIALAEYIRHKKQQKILDLFHEIEYNKDYDYKKYRNRHERTR